MCSGLVHATERQGTTLLANDLGTFKTNKIEIQFSVGFLIYVILFR